MIRQFVRIEGRRLNRGQDATGGRFDRNDRADLVAEALECRFLRCRIDRRGHGAAGALSPGKKLLDAVDEEQIALTIEDVVLSALETGGPVYE